ncbi:hypothetical protein [Haloplanus natans]|uniref:hypothetical protein n=1 Tax=Haloplanus natans TaxID=376171 RepID=UPI0006779C84|nr:hypothetical protein [Haloplanus natans]
MSNDKTTRTASKRIPKSIETDANVFGRYTLTDLAVGAFPGVVVALVLQVLIPPATTVAGYRLATFTLPATAVAIALGGIVVYLTPAYLTTAQWLGMILGFQWRPSHIPHPDTLAHTHVTAMHPDHDVIERTDGAFVGVIQVTPPPMALATDSEWAAKADAFQEFLNTSVEFPIQLYSTTRPFPVDEYLAHYEARRTDADVRNNPQLATLIDEYISWYRTELEQRRMTIRDHYVIVPVSPAEVRFEQQSLTQQLTRLPVLGVFIEAVCAPRQDEERAAMFEAVDDRVRQLRTGLRGIDGCDVERISASEAAEVLATFWRGEHVEYEDADRVITTRPVVGGSR